jgi:hypothetical protein
MRYFSTKSKSTRSIAGISGILLLLFGVLSLIFQYSTTVPVYAQVGWEPGDLGPLVVIDGRSQTLDSGSDNQDDYVAFVPQGSSRVDLAKVVPDAGGRSGALDGIETVIPGGTDPAVVVTPGGDVFVAAVAGGEIVEVGCADDEDNCTDPESVSDPEPAIETSCFDGVDNDGDGEADSDDSDCFACFSSGGPDVAGFSGGMGARMQFVTAVPDPEQLCPFEAGDVCDDTIDNDGDGVADAEDPDCSIEGGFVSLPFGGPNCNDGIDNDGDELTDNEDPGCNEAGEGPCSDEIDNDGDGLADGEDPGCTVEPPVGIEGEGSSTEFSCRDGLDNDGDERVDVADVDCKWSSQQTSSERGLCSDEIDNDGDEAVDSDDEDCFQPQIDLQGSDSDGQTADAEGGDNETADVEPTSFNLQTGTATSPQLTFVTTGPAPPASNPDNAASDDGSDVYFVWEEEGDIMFSASHDGGDTWSEKLNLSNNAGVSREPRVDTSSDGQFVHVAWQDNTPGNDEIFYSRGTSTDGVETFNGGSPVGSPINLSNTGRTSNDHQLVAEGSNVYVCWVDYTTGNGDIYFRKSNNNGATFSSTINLSRGSGLSFLSSRDPDMAAQGSLVSVIWSVHPDRAATGPGEIIFRESTNNGGSFGSHIVVSKTLRTDSREPQIDYTPEDNERYAGWHDKGGPRRVYTTAGTFNVLASESDNGRTFSAPVNLSDAPNNPDPGKQTSQLQVVDDVAIWDPTSRRG